MKRWLSTRCDEQVFQLASLQNRERYLMELTPTQRLELSEKIAKGVEYEIKDYDPADKRLIVAFLDGWFQSYMKRGE